MKINNQTLTLCLLVLLALYVNKTITSQQAIVACVLMAIVKLNCNGKLFEGMSSADDNQSVVNFAELIMNLIDTVQRDYSSSGNITIGAALTAEEIKRNAISERIQEIRSIAQTINSQSESNMSYEIQQIADNMLNILNSSEIYNYNQLSKYLADLDTTPYDQDIIYTPESPLVVTDNDADDMRVEGGFAIGSPKLQSGWKCDCTCEN